MTTSAKQSPIDWDVCPECGKQLHYEVDGETYTRIMSIYDRDLDRTVAWGCPWCKYRWER